MVKDGEKLGSTEYVATLIQQTVGGDLFCIKTVEAYPLDHPLVDHASEERDVDFRPELATHVENFEQYEWIMQVFIQETQTDVLGASFLRIACLAVPLTAVNALIIYTMQAMGEGGAGRRL